MTNFEEKIKEKTNVVQCPRCAGWGNYTVDDQRNWETCSLCNGKGTLDVVSADVVLKAYAEDPKDHLEEVKALKETIQLLKEQGEKAEKYYAEQDGGRKQKLQQYPHPIINENVWFYFQRLEKWFEEVLK